MNHIPRELSEQAHKALLRSETFARQYPDDTRHIKPIHLLYALSRQNGSLAKTFLTAYNIAPRNILTLVKLEAGKRRAVHAKHAPVLSPNTRRVLRQARSIAKQHDQQFVGTEHLLFALLDKDVSPLPREVGAHIQDQIKGLLEHVIQLPITAPVHEKHEGHAEHTKHEPWDDESPARPHVSPLRAYCHDLTSEISATENPLIGRQKEINHIVRVLLRRTKNNPLLVGDPGVGKTEIIRGLAHHIRAHDVPPSLQGVRLLALDLPALIAGTMFRGEFESRVRDLVEEASAQNVILFIDEIHTLAGAGAAQGSLDAANMLKPALARGDIRCIGATTFEEYTKHIEKDAALARRFQYISIAEETPEESQKTLTHVKHLYEKHHRVAISNEALEAAVALSSRYIQGRALPDKALDVLDEAASHVQQRGGSRVNSSHIAEIVSESTGIPVGTLTRQERERYRTIETELAIAVVGQATATNIVANTLKRKKAGVLEETRPFGSFLFVGPSGVGKTELAKTLARVLANSPNKTPANLIALDMSEYGEAHNVARLIGSPPGYVGHEEGGQLTARVRRMPYSVILFDEIEKAHPHVLNILLQILEEGALTDGQGRRVSFSQTLIVLTSNIGTEIWGNKHTLGFGGTTKEISAKHDYVVGQIKEIMRPEIINRLDHIVPFSPLSKTHIRTIARTQLSELCMRLSPNHAIRIAPGVEAWVALAAMAEDKGARGVRGVIATHIEPLLADDILKRNSHEIHLAMQKKNIVVR